MRNSADIWSTIAEVEALARIETTLPDDQAVVPGDKAFVLVCACAATREEAERAIREFLRGQDFHVIKFEETESWAERAQRGRIGSELEEMFVACWASKQPVVGPIHTWENQG